MYALNLKEIQPMMMHAEKRGEPLRRSNIYLSREQLQSLKEIGAAQDVSMAEIVRRVLDKYIRREQRKAAKRAEGK
jgi:hypothetical protein